MQAHLQICCVLNNLQGDKVCEQTLFQPRMPHQTGSKRVKNRSPSSQHSRSMRGARASW